MGKSKSAKGPAKAKYVVAHTFDANRPKPMHQLIKGYVTKFGGVTAGGSKKRKASYGSETTSVLELHDAQDGFSWTDAAAVEAEPSPVEQEAELAKRLVEHLVDTTDDVRELCERYGLKREELGRLTGFSLRALAEWANGQLPSQPARRRLKEIRRLLDALSEIVQRERIPEWLRRPNPTFAPLTPMQVIELGEIDRLWAMVHDLASGQPD
ncbi:MAG TPA: helix-turn-helix transcriptional regulator [Verrucomicrobiae bacterium]